jgi:hypothetical protein
LPSPSGLAWRFGRGWRNWQTGSIGEATATISLYTMIFAVALAAVKLLQAPATDLDSPAVNVRGRRLSVVAQPWNREHRGLNQGEAADLVP